MRGLKPCIGTAVAGLLLGLQLLAVVSAQQMQTQTQTPVALIPITPQTQTQLSGWLSPSQPTIQPQAQPQVQQPSMAQAQSPTPFGGGYIVQPRVHPLSLQPLGQGDALYVPQQQQQPPQQQPQPYEQQPYAEQLQSMSEGLSTAAQAAVREAHKRSSAELRTLFGSTRAELTCSSPQRCGIHADMSLHDAVLAHTDLSIPALHLSMFPFLQPAVDLMTHAPCNVTLAAPASTGLLKIMRYQAKKYCSVSGGEGGSDISSRRANQHQQQQQLQGEGDEYEQSGQSQKWARSDACRTLRQLVQLDEVAARNAKRLAAQGAQPIQLVQMRALKQMIRESADAFMQAYTQRQQQGQQASDEEICDARTVFLPRARDLQQFFDFIAQSAMQRQGGRRQQQQQPSQQPGLQQQSPHSSVEWQREPMQSPEQQPESSQRWQTGRMRQLSDADIAEMCANWRRDQQAARRFSDKGDDYYDEGYYYDEGDSYEQDQQSQLGAPSQTDSDLPRLRVQSLRVSTFMQRLILAAISNSMQPFAAVTADMPVHLIGPNLNVDPAFVNKGDRGQGAQQQQGHQQQGQQQLGQQQPMVSSFSSASATFGQPFHLRGLGKSMGVGSSGLQSFAWQSPSLSGSIDPPDPDTQLDVKIAAAFGVTPADLESRFQPGVRTQFATTGKRPQSTHYEKEERGVKIKWGSPLSVIPPSATILSGDIRVRDAVLHITDIPTSLPASTSSALRVNGLNAFRALASAAGQRTADALDHEPAITIFVPQDSALSQIVQQLPWEHLRWLIRAVSKYKEKRYLTSNVVRQLRDQERQSGQQQPQRQQPHQQGSDRQGQRVQRESRNQRNEFSVNGGVDRRARSWSSAHEQRSHQWRSLGQSESHSHLRRSGLQGGGRSDASDYDVDQEQSSWSDAGDQSGIDGGFQFEDEFDGGRRTESDIQGGAQQSGGQAQQPQSGGLRPDLLAQFVQAHIVSGLIHSPDLGQLQSVTTMGGASFPVQCGAASRTLIVGGANLLFTDILSKNAVIHVIDRPMGYKEQQQQDQQGRQQQEQDLETSPEADRRVYVRPDLPLTDVLAEQDQPAHLQLAKRLLSWSLDEFRVAPQQSRQRLRAGSGSMGRQQLGSWKMVSASPFTGQQRHRQRQQKLRGIRALSLQTMSHRLGASAGEEGESGGSEMCLYPSSRQCRLVDSLQRNAAWQRMQSTPQKLFSASNEPHDISCQLAHGASSADARDGFTASTITKCYSPEAYVCANERLSLKEEANQQQPPPQQQQQQQLSQTMQSPIVAQSSAAGRTYGGGMN